MSSAVATGSVIVCETAPRWVPELQRQLARDRIPVRLRAGASDVLAQLGTPGPRVLVINFQNQEAAALQLLDRIGRAGLDYVPCIAVAPAQDLSLEWTVRELGADLFYEEPTRPDQLANLIRKLLNNFLN